MQQALKFIFLSIICMTMLLFNLKGQEFPCDGSIYYVGTNTVVGSKLYKLNVDPLTRQIRTEELPLSNPDGRHITALGYNVRDRMLYGLDFNTNELLRINSQGDLQVLAQKEIDPVYEFYSGGMSANGRRLLLIGRNKDTGQDDRLYSIQVNEPGYPIGFFALNANRPVKMTDYAINPRTGIGYSFDEDRQQLVEMSDSGFAFTDLGHKEVNQVFGALFFDRGGNLYGIGRSGGGSGEQTTIYGIDKGTGLTERITQVPGGRDADACGCPYTLDFKKRIYPKAVDGCGEITIEYSSLNHGGIGQVGVQLRDTLPEGFMITSVELPQEDVFIRKISGEGTNIFAVDDWNLLIGQNKLTIKVELMRNIAGPVFSWAQLKKLYAAYGYQVFSDDPDSPEPDDPTVLDVLDANSFELEDYIQYSCDLDTAYLHLPLRGTYSWSTGSSDSVLAVTQNGTYALTLTTECFTVEDEIELERRQEPYFVYLGEDRVVNLGAPVSLSFQHNLEGIKSIRWRSLGNDSLDCTGCNTTSLTAINDGQVSVSVLDDRGCTFTDEVAYKVRQTKNIYLPDAFSPNGDGINDFFSPLGDKGTILQFDIVDRWGSRVFRHSGGEVNKFEGWDGLSREQVVASGSYFYRLQIRFPDEEVEEFQGTVILLR